MTSPSSNTRSIAALKPRRFYLIGAVAVAVWARRLRLHHVRSSTFLMKAPTTLSWRESWHASVPGARSRSSSRRAGQPARGRREPAGGD